MPLSLEEVKRNMKQANSMLDYIDKRNLALDAYYYCTDNEEFGYKEIRGIEVMCSDEVFERLVAHAHRYYPDIVIKRMSERSFILHTTRPLIIVD